MIRRAFNPMHPTPIVIKQRGLRAALLLLCDYAQAQIEHDELNERVDQRMDLMVQGTDMKPMYEHWQIERDHPSP